MRTIYSALFERAESLKINIATSGFVLEGTTFPHISISQISSIPSQEDSCVSRIEENRYQFSIYSLNFEEAQDYIESIRHNYSFATLDLDYRRFNSIHYETNNFGEPEPGIYHAIISFLIYTEKDFSSNRHHINSLRFYDGITSINEESIKANLILGDQLEGTQLPYVSLSNLQSMFNDAHSLGILRNDNFSFHLYDNNQVRLEETIEKFHDNYDYSRIDIQNKYNLTIQWLMNTIVETEPGIWRAKMDYAAINEELING